MFCKTTNAASIMAVHPRYIQTIFGRNSSILSFHYILSTWHDTGQACVQQLFRCRECSLAAGTCLPSRYLPKVASSGSTNLTVRRQVRFNSNVFWCCVFCAVRFISNTQHVGKGSRQFFSELLALFKIRLGKNTIHFPLLWD
jgi:hypothetical protein